MGYKRAETIDALQFDMGGEINGELLASPLPTLSLNLGVLPEHNPSEISHQVPYQRVPRRTRRPRNTG